MGYISETARIKGSTYSEIKLYRNASLIESSCEAGVSIGDDTTIERCTLGKNVVINRRCYVNDSTIGDFTYAGINTTINFSNIGKFCSIARNVDIGGFDHDYKKVTTMPEFRFAQMKNGAAPIPDNNEKCTIGNDVWIAAGSQILHKANIGDGAVIGGGAVVTKDVPPYAIVAGVPAKVIKLRFSEELIDELLKIRWWDWPEELILENMDWMMKTDVTMDTIGRMKEVRKPTVG